MVHSWHPIKREEQVNRRINEGGREGKRGLFVSFSPPTEPNDLLACANIFLKLNF